jgi:hypothetical protein
MSKKVKRTSAKNRELSVKIITVVLIAATVLGLVIPLVTA